VVGLNIIYINLINMLRTFLFTIAALFTIVTGQATCPEVKIQENFDLNRYVGTWYQHSLVKGAPYENGNCEQARYRIKDMATGEIEVFNTQYN
jgi:lipocalin